MGSMGMARAPAAAVAPRRQLSADRIRFSGLSSGIFETTTMSAMSNANITTTKISSSRMSSTKLSMFIFSGWQCQRAHV